MGEGFAEPSHPDRPDAAHVREFGVSRFDNRGDGPEMSEESPRGDRRDRRDRCQHGFCGRDFRPLRVQRPVRRRTRPSGSARYAVEPQGGVGLRLAAHNRHPVLAGGQQRAPDRRRRDRAGVERRSFDEQKRPSAGGTEPPELPPQTTRDECQVQVAHALTLDDRTFHSVVPDRQTMPQHLHAEASQLGSNPFRLVHVDLHANHLNPHAKIVPAKTSRICANRSREARTR